MTWGLRDLTYDAKRNMLDGMIRSFRSKETEDLFQDCDVPRFRAFERIARRKLLYLNRARVLGDLQAPPGNRLEALKGSRKGQHSIRINDQWRFALFGEMGMHLRLESSTTIEVANENEKSW
jgi:proteic killer suppression protein